MALVLAGKRNVHCCSRRSKYRGSLTKRILGLLQKDRHEGARKDDIHRVLRHVRHILGRGHGLELIKPGHSPGNLLFGHVSICHYAPPLDSWSYHKRLDARAAPWLSTCNFAHTTSSATMV